MKLKLAFILLDLLGASIYASGSESWLSDDESEVPLRTASADTVAPDFSGLCDDEFPEESVEIYYETDDEGRPTSVIISCTTAQFEHQKQSIGLVKFGAQIGNALSISTISAIENSIKDLVKTSNEYALNDDQINRVNEAIEKLKIELIKAKNKEFLTHKK